MAKKSETKKKTTKKAESTAKKEAPAKKVVKAVEETAELEGAIGQRSIKLKIKNTEHDLKLAINRAGHIE